MRRPESKQNRIARMAGQAFVGEERDRQGERRIVDEEKRQAAASAKTAKLRGLREARDAAEHDASPRAVTSEPEAGTRARVLRPGVRLRKGGK
jgi:hypothetical protein